MWPLSSQELESAATSDAVVREKIASLPDEVSDVSLLTKLQGEGKIRISISENVFIASCLLSLFNLSVCSAICT